jgi:hypothetical protein
MPERFFKYAKISSSGIDGRLSTPKTSGELWQNPHLKLQPAVKTVAATYPSKSTKDIFSRPEIFISALAVKDYINYYTY